MDTKKLAAEKAVEYIKDGMIVGLGTGSTATRAIEGIGEKVKAGLKIQAVASSVTSENLARQLGIPIISFSQIKAIDLTIDGADEVDETYNLIKGGGGALLREKVLAYNTTQFMVIVDESKLVHQLGSFPLPVEIIPFATNLTLKHLQELGCVATIRQKDGKDFVTDNGNLIADCHFKQIPDPGKLNQQIHLIPGVAECGIFPHTMVSHVIVGYANGAVEVLK